MISNAFTTKLIVTAAGLFFALGVRAQTRVNGEVTGPLGEAVPGAHVRLKGSRAGAVADSLGKFDFLTTQRATRRSWSHRSASKRTSKPLLLPTVR